MDRALNLQTENRNPSPPLLHCNLTSAVGARRGGLGPFLFGGTMSEQQEEWLPVVGYEDLYSVSNFGRVQRVAGGRGARPGHMSKVWLSLTSGYAMVGLTKLSVKRIRAVHILVAEAFLGPRPEGYECHHKNGVRADARLVNIEWVLPTQNQYISYALHGREAPRGERSGKSVFTEEDVKKILEKAMCGMRQMDIARTFGVSEGAINGICHGRTWGHVARPEGWPGLFQYSPKTLGRMAGRCKKLTDAQIDEARMLFASGISNKNLSIRFGVGHPTMSRICAGQRRSATREVRK